MMAVVAAYSPEFIQADTCSTLVLSHSCLLVRKCEHLHFFHLFFMVMRAAMVRLLSLSLRPCSNEIGSGGAVSLILSFDETWLTGQSEIWLVKLFR